MFQTQQFVGIHAECKKYALFLYFGRYRAVCISLSAEAGTCWSVWERGVLLYAGIYVDYGLLNIAPSKTSALVHRPAEDLTVLAYNSMLSAALPAGRYVDKVNLLSAGLKVKVALGL